MKKQVASSPVLATKPGKMVKSITKNGASDLQNKMIAEAFKRCGIDCVTTFEAESGWRGDAKNTKNRNGTYDIGECQLNSQYHLKFIKSEAFKDPWNRLNYCLDVWDDAKRRNRLSTTWYAFAVRNTPGVIKRFTIVYE